jgi:formylglycine-generating enzyme required for sulfatase activity
MPGKVFYAARYEVTWREYLVAVREKACPLPEKSFGGFYDPNDPHINDNYPLTGVSPDVFSCYLHWLKERTGNTYRIPSAAEWEHVARAGTSTDYYWGDELGFNNAIVFDYFDLPALKRRLNYPQGKLDNSLHDPRLDVDHYRVFPVGQFKPNPWGLYDVIGNAAEVTTEAYPPAPGCLKHNSPMICEQLSARGADRIRSPNPAIPNPPITQSLMTSRFRTSAHGGNHRTGFRLVRD